MICDSAKFSDKKIILKNQLNLNISKNATFDIVNKRL